MLELLAGDLCQPSMPCGLEEEIEAAEQQALRDLSRADRLAMEAQGLAQQVRERLYVVSEARAVLMGEPLPSRGEREDLRCWESLVPWD